MMITSADGGGGGVGGGYSVKQEIGLELSKNARWMNVTFVCLLFQWWLTILTWTDELAQKSEQNKNEWVQFWRSPGSITKQYLSRSSLLCWLMSLWYILILKVKMFFVQRHLVIVEGRPRMRNAIKAESVLFRRSTFRLEAN